jgi:hypothetical protein
MDQPAPDTQQASPETLHALADQYVDRHSSPENYFLCFAIESWLLRRLGLEPLSWPGRLVGGLVWLLMVLVPALILTALTGQWADAALGAWILIAAGFGGIGLFTTPLVRSATRNLLSWLWAIVDEADLRRLSTWEHRWYSHRILVPVSTALTLGLVLWFYLSMLRNSGVPVPAGTLYVGAFIVFMVMQNASTMVLVAAEAYNLSTCRYELYRLSPADSVVVRRSVHGYNQLGALNVMMTTFMILLFLLLLPGGSRLVGPVVVSLLLLEYACTAVGTLVPRLFLGRIIRLKREEEMENLQVRLNSLLPRVGRLTGEEHEELTQLLETHDAIRDSPDTLLPLGAILQMAGALLLSTVTILATVFAEEWLGALAKRFVP